MSEESDLERTEPASQRRLEKSRDEGQVPRSQELSTFVVLITAGAGLWLMGGPLARQLANLMRDGMKIPRSFGFDPALLLERLLEQSLHALLALSPFFLLMMIAALVAPLLLSGWLFTWKSLAPDFKRINPLKGVGRMFSTNSMIELAKALLKAALIGAMAVWTIWHDKDAVLSLVAAPLGASIGHLGELAVMSFLAIAGMMALVAAVDVPFKLWDHARRLRMTKEEVRQENKETEGDPHVKSRIRAQQHAMARKRMMAEIPAADVIVTNPTHFAVALKYEEGKMHAPRVVAKGRHLLALRIREIGEQHRVPLLEAPPLARALYHHAELGDEIPQALYNAVAEVLAYVYQLRRYHEQGGGAPRKPETLPVPAALDPESAGAGGDGPRPDRP
ncbi:flagellar biosynthesis protein FlhB [Nitrosovibrio sp. Nv17]|uniref:flagellar biosynthesis protein FlhB n=1 Tax=Nitrosovibrio sp. Nv17 TaxID=1855339 RepID=UPI000908E8EA|nr:flagellar biosynthesis protein FlhB [Nitrosovibrio sp. Nv17]SFW32298.1 flagellar biosynthetic protein FlhB [Nitrosovibrio sp. Nv17]